MSSKDRTGQASKGETAESGKEREEQELEEALEETFPASDPVAVGHTTAVSPDRPLNRRPAKIDRRMVDALARAVEERHKPAGRQ